MYYDWLACILSESSWAGTFSISCRMPSSHRIKCIFGSLGVPLGRRYSLPAMRKSDAHTFPCIRSIKLGISGTSICHKGNTWWQGPWSQAAIWPWVLSCQRGLWSSRGKERKTRDSIGNPHLPLSWYSKTVRSLWHILRTCLIFSLGHHFNHRRGK